MFFKYLIIQKVRKLIRNHINLNAIVLILVCVLSPMSQARTTTLNCPLGIVQASDHDEVQGKDSFIQLANWSLDIDWDVSETQLYHKEINLISSAGEKVDIYTHLSFDPNVKGLFAFSYVTFVNDKRLNWDFFLLKDNGTSSGELRDRSIPNGATKVSMLKPDSFSVNPINLMINDVIWKQLKEMIENPQREERPLIGYTQNVDLQMILLKTDLKDAVNNKLFKKGQIVGTIIYTDCWRILK